MKKLVILTLAIPVFLSSCFDTELVFEDQFEPVIQAYLFKNQPVEGVRITSMYSFGTDTTIGGQNISDALVILQQGDNTWQLEHNDDDSGSYFLNEAISMVAGDTFRLAATIGDDVYSAFTVVPDDPPVVTMSTDTIMIDRVVDMMDFRDMEMPDPVEFTWDNPDARYFFIRVQNIESYEDNIMPDPPDDMPFKHDGFNFQMDSRPINDSVYELTPRELTHYGTHQIIIYSVNEEYVALYNTQEQDSHELNEPFTNIEEGLGIFTAFTSDTLYLEVIDNQ